MVLDSPSRRKAPPLDPHRNTFRSSSPARRGGPRPLSPNNMHRQKTTTFVNDDGGDPWTKNNNNWNASTTTDTRQQPSPGRGGGTSFARQPSPPSSPTKLLRSNVPPSPEASHRQTVRQRARMLEGGHHHHHRSNSGTNNNDEWFATVVPTATAATPLSTSPNKWGRSVQDDAAAWEATTDEWRFGTASQDGSDGERSLYDDSGEKIHRVTNKVDTTTVNHSNNNNNMDIPTPEGSPQHPIPIHDMDFLDERDQGILEAAHTKHLRGERRQKQLPDNFSVSSVDSASKKKKKGGGGIMGFFRGVSVVQHIWLVGCFCCVWMHTGSLTVFCRIFQFYRVVVARTRTKRRKKRHLCRRLPAAEDLLEDFLVRSICFVIEPHRGILPLSRMLLVKVH